MKTLLTATAALSLLLAPLAVEAGPKGRGNGNGNGNSQGNGNGAWAQGFHCPPGLAGRDPACVPPGQARHDDRDRDDDEAERSGGDRGDTEDWAEDIVEADADGDDRNMRQGLAIVGSLVGLALLDQARRDAQAEAAPAEPVAAAPAPSYFSFSEVPARPATIETLAATSEFGDATDPGPALPLAMPVVAPSPSVALSPSIVIPPPPPMAEDVTELLSGSATASTGY